MASNIESLSAELDEQLEQNQVVDPRLLPVRFSRLKLMSLSPAHYYSACQRRDDGDDSLALRMGSGVHAMVLDQPVIKFPGRRAGKAWDSFQAEHKDKVILNDREWHEARSMSSAILCNREAMQLLFEGTIIETPINWQYCGRACSSRPDAHRPLSHVTELKTARWGKPPWFTSAGLRMNYHAQVAFYAEAIECSTGHAPANAYAVVVEKFPPFAVTIFRFTDRALEAGRKLNRLWMEQLLACESANEWPAYSESIVDFDMPPENDNAPFEVEIDGSLVELSA